MASEGLALDSVGWIGTGRMGSAMVDRLIRSGTPVAVYNRTRAKTEPLAKLGATVVEAPAELAARDVVFVTVSSSKDLEEVLVGPSGLLSGALRPKVVVDCSTVSAEASASVRKVLAERGVEFLAAPVSGNPKVARAGRLTMAVSGPSQVFAAVEPLLAALGAGSTYVGEGELSRLVKLCHNIHLGVVAQSLAEVTVMAEKGGVSRHAFLRYLNHSVLGSAFTGYKTPALVNLDYTATFTANLLRKDFDLGLAAARDLEVPMPVAALVHQLVQALVGQGFGDADFAALIEMVARDAGWSLVSEKVEVADGLESPR